MTVEPQPSSKPAHESAQEHKPAYEYFSDDPSFPTRRVIGVMFVGAFLGYLNETLLNVALTSFMQEFGVDKTTVQWMATGFLLVMGALAPLTASLVQWVPTRRLTLLTLATFLAGSLICAMAPSFWVLLAGRLVQALSGALTMPLLMNATLAIYPPNRRGKVMGMVAMVFSVAPALGPTLSGLIVDHLGWRWLFLLTMPFVLVSMGLVWRYLKVDIIDITRPRIDALSVLLSVAGFGGLVFIGSSFSDMPVAQAVLVAVASVLLILAFALRQFRLRTPLLNLRAFGYPQYAFAVIVLASNVFLFLGMELLLPMYAQQVLMLSATVTGLILLPGSIVQALLLPAFGTLLDRRGGRFVVLPGAVLMLVSLVVMWMSITPSAHAVWLATLFTLFSMAGAATMTSETVGLNGVPREMNPHGAAIMSTLMPIAGALGAAFFVGITHLGEALWGRGGTAMAGSGYTVMTEAARASMLDGLQLAFGLAPLFALLMVWAAFRFPRDPAPGGSGH